MRLRALGMTVVLPTMLYWAIIGLCMKGDACEKHRDTVREKDRTEVKESWQPQGTLLNQDTRTTRQKIKISWGGEKFRLFVFQMRIHQNHPYRHCRRVGFAISGVILNSVLRRVHAQEETASKQTPCRLCPKMVIAIRFLQKNLTGCFL